jgi:hypothetical protein
VPLRESCRKTRSHPACVGWIKTMENWSPHAVVLVTRQGEGSKERGILRLGKSGVRDVLECTG